MLSNGEITVPNQPRPSYALIDGAEISELDLLRYEVTRARTAAFLLYERIGAQGMAELLKFEIATMQQIEHEWAKQSASEWAGSITEVRVNGGSASGFLTWFRERVASDDRAVMFNAHPEHYAVIAAPDGSGVDIGDGRRVEAPWPFLCAIHPGRARCRRGAQPYPARSPDWPSRIREWRGARTGTTPIRDTPYGFRARLGIYWPAKAQPEMIKGHQWHLACMSALRRNGPRVSPYLGDAGSKRRWLKALCGSLSHRGRLT
jgi:hypothetical protein